MAEIFLLRHGETEWSLSGQHTGRTDIPLTENGRKRAEQLRGPLVGKEFGLVLSSPLRRAQDTARLAGLTVTDTDLDLLEWDYGAYEGLSTASIRKELDDPTWVIWDSPIPPGLTPGESVAEVADRTTKVLARCLPLLESGRDAMLVAHGHVLRILTATWLGLEPGKGRLFRLDAGALCRLGYEHEQHVITKWNQA